MPNPVWTEAREATQERTRDMIEHLAQHGALADALDGMDELDSGVQYETITLTEAIRRAEALCDS